MRTLHSGVRGGHYVISSGRKVYLKVKSSSKKTGPKKKKSSALKKKTGSKKKTSSALKKKTGPKKKMYIPRISNLKKFKLFRGGSIEEGKVLFERIISAANSVSNTGNNVANRRAKRIACERIYIDYPLKDILKIFEYLASTEPYKYITILFKGKSHGKILAAHWGGERSQWLKNEGENVDSNKSRRKRILDNIVRFHLEDPELFTSKKEDITKKFKI